MTIPTQGEDLEKRDAIARIVDPEAWEECFPLEGDPDPVGAEIFGEAITESLSKADAILSMISAVPSIEGGEGDSSPSQTSPSCPQMGNETPSLLVWRDISSAPRDGTSVLLWIPGKPASTGYVPPGKVIRGLWERDIYARAPKPFWKPDDYRTSGLVHCRQWPPTHWMPLPPAPSSVADSSGSRPQEAVKSDGPRGPGGEG